MLTSMYKSSAGRITNVNITKDKINIIQIKPRPYRLIWAPGKFFCSLDSYAISELKAPEFGC